jgi:hypothetical protein
VTHTILHECLLYAMFRQGLLTDILHAVVWEGSCTGIIGVTILTVCSDLFLLLYGKMFVINTGSRNITAGYLRLATVSWSYYGLRHHFLINDFRPVNIPPAPFLLLHYSFLDFESHHLNSPSVVIAGGTSASLGATIVQGILCLAAGWKPIVVSHPTSAVPAWLSPLLADGKVGLRRADYADHAALISVFRGVHTVISVLFSAPDTWFATRISLFIVAKDAGVKRFAPSKFGVGIKATPQIDALAGNQDVWKACEESGLEWTRFENGLFMNYLGFAARDDRRAEALAGRQNDGEWFYYTTQRRAELPVKSDGTFPRITMTAMEDIGKMWP